MSPRTGRPPIENPKSDRVTIRLTEHEQKILSECVEEFGTSNAEVIRRGLALMKAEKNNSEARQLLDAIVLLDDYVSDKRTDLIAKQVEQVKCNFQWFLDSIMEK